MATFTHCEELALERDESKDAADAIREIAQYYGASFDPKKVAIFNGCVVAARLYVPRVIAIRNRLKTESAVIPQPSQVETPKRQQQRAPVTEINLREMSPSQLSGYQSAEI